MPRRYACSSRSWQCRPDSRAAGARLSECRAILDAQKADAQRVKVARSRGAGPCAVSGMGAGDYSLRRDPEHRSNGAAWRSRCETQGALSWSRNVSEQWDFDLEHVVVQLIHSARASFNRGRCDEALETLRAFLVRGAHGHRCPDASSTGSARLRRVEPTRQPRVPRRFNDAPMRRAR